MIANDNNINSLFPLSYTGLLPEGLYMQGDSASNGPSPNLPLHPHNGIQQMSNPSIAAGEAKRKQTGIQTSSIRTTMRPINC